MSISEFLAYRFSHIQVAINASAVMNGRLSRRCCLFICYRGNFFANTPANIVTYIIVNEILLLQMSRMREDLRRQENVNPLDSTVSQFKTKAPPVRALVSPHTRQQEQDGEDHKIDMRYEGGSHLVMVSHTSHCYS